MSVSRNSPTDSASRAPGNRLDNHFTYFLRKQQKWGGEMLLNMLFCQRNSLNHKIPKLLDCKRRMSTHSMRYSNIWQIDTRNVFIKHMKNKI